MRLALLVALAGCASAPPTPPPPAASLPPAAVAPENVSLAEVGLDAANLDRNVNPCDDFYRFACGGWLDKHEIPSDSASYGTFTQAVERTQEMLHQILEEAARSPSDDPVLKKIGDYYASCMDEEGIEKLGMKPLEPLLAAVRKVKDTKTLLVAVAELQRNGVDVFFTIGPVQDKKDATQMIAEIGQGGLGLPDRDYYLDDSPPADGLRQAYRAHLERMFVLLGKKVAEAKRGAADTLAIELAIAKSHKARVELRDEHGTYNRIDRVGLAKAAPKLDWDGYFAALGAPDVQAINAVSVAYVDRFETLATFFKPAQWQSYLAVRALEDKAGLLARRFVDESFAFQKLLSGQKELRARWKRCVSLTDRDLGELLAQPYIARAFSGDSKERALAVIKGVAAAFSKNLDAIPWMDDATRKKAREKLGKIALQIGYPQAWRNYDFPIQRTAFAESALAAVRAEIARLLGKVGKPIDRDEWAQTPPTVDAFYDASLNREMFPAGILQPPAFSAKASAAVNFGAAGAVMGHELTHGFDDQGAQYDGDGNLSGWWPEKVTEGFKERTQCVAKSYSQYEALPGLHVNGALTNGENIADMGGIKMAFAAYRAARAGARPQVADGLSEDQQFFLAFAGIWCGKRTDENQKELITADPHSPGRFRVIGALSNLPAFAAAFQCPVGSTMHPKDVCEVW